MVDAHLLRRLDMPLRSPATLGLITLIGLISKHGILIVEFSNQLQRQGADKLTAVKEAAALRLRPILMTTLTTILGMLPLIISRDPLFYDMAVTIASGLAFATVLTLGLAPVLYATIMRVPSPER